MTDTPKGTLDYIARTADQTLNGVGRPRRFGVVVLVYPFGQPTIPAQVASNDDPNKIVPLLNNYLRVGGHEPVKSEIRTFTFKAGNYLTVDQMADRLHDAGFIADVGTPCKIKAPYSETRRPNGDIVFHQWEADD